MTQEGVDMGSSVGYALKVAATALRTAMDGALRPLDLSVSQYSCLEVLRQRPGLSAAELARATFVTRQSAHALLQGLEHRGLLSRPTAPASGRALPTRLTADGVDVLARATRLVAEVEERMLAGATASDRARLLDDLTACAAALDAPVAAGRAPEEGTPA